MARDRLGRDEGGQMMMLAAVLLVIGFIALAGMVARVNQLGTQTSTESEQAILGEVGPLQDALDAGISRLEGRSLTGTTKLGILFVTSAAPNYFYPSDVGFYITAPSIVGTATITAYNSPTNVTISLAAGGLPSQTVTLNVFALSASTTPTLEEGVVALLEQLQRIQSSHGLSMEWTLSCATAGVPTTGIALAALSDGVVWVQVSSTQQFTRSSCTTLTG